MTEQKIAEMGPMEQITRDIQMDLDSRNPAGCVRNAFHERAREQDAIRARLVTELERLLSIDDGRFFAHESWDDARAALRDAKS